MNTLTQGMIETIVLNGIYNKGGKPGLETWIACLPLCTWVYIWIS